MPHFQLVVGGQWTNNGGTYGLAIGAVPSKRIPEVVKRLTARYAAENARTARRFRRSSPASARRRSARMVEELQVLPRYDQDPSFYTDWGDPREYTIGDMGVGECAGEVVPMRRVRPGRERARDLRGADAARRAARSTDAASRAYSAMLEAARALAREKNPNVSAEPDEIVGEFRKHFYDTQLFFDPYAGGKFAQYFFRAHEEHDKRADRRGGAPADRGGDAVRRRRPPVLHAPRLVAGRPGVALARLDVGPA